MQQQQQQQQQQQPPQNMPPVWGAPTVVTPMPPDMMQPPYGNQPPGDQRYIQTVVAPNAQEIGGYPETIVTPSASSNAPPQPSSSGTEPIGDAASTAQVPRAPEPPAPEAPGAGGGPTQDMSRPPTPPQAPAAPPGGQSTIVMSSTPVAAPPKPARLLLIMEGGEVGETFGVRPAETVIGRVDGDIKFPHDGYMSSRHARILQRNGRFFLIDNNSRNGTFVKIHQEVELHPGDVILVGKQLFRFETDE
jgi:hypothetical protein